MDQGALRRTILLSLLLAGLLGLHDQQESAVAVEPHPTGAAERSPLLTRLHVPPPAPEAIEVADLAVDPVIYVDDRVQVRPTAGTSLAAIALDHGAHLVRLPGPSGYGILATGPDQGVPALRASLLADERVLSASAIGRISGAGAPQVGWDQWQLESSGVPDWEEYWDDPGQVPDFSGVVVAVLDSGAAYEDHSDASGTYVAAESLASVPVLSPWDFVNGDSHANDDHFHGTHIASVILGDGTVHGIAPGATLMPLKVLDAANSGIETDLVDALYHAVDSGADVINMSLSFTLGYLPSPALSDAITYAADSGVLMIAASGNDGVDAVSFPAAFRDVIAVGASTLKNGRGLKVSSYSNVGTGVLLVGTGGDLLRDKDKDGLPDGVLAESITPGDPTTTGLWLAAGTSQAAAIISGSAVQLIAAGASDDDARTALILSATNEWGNEPYHKGGGAGQTRLDSALSELDTYDPTSFQPREYGVAMLPYLVDGGETARVEARLSVVDATGAAAVGVRVIGSIDGPAGSTSFQCVTASTGECTAESEDFTAPDVETEALGWAIQASHVVAEDVAYSPRSVLFGTQGLEVLVAAVAADEDAAGRVLALRWETETDADVGPTLESYAVVDAGGSGIVTSPVGFLFTPGVLSHATLTPMDLDLDGSGIVTSPVGLLPIWLIDFGGSGIVTSPVGFLPPRLLVIGGSGIVTSPVGISGFAFFTLGGSGIVTSPVGFDPTPPPLPPGGGFLPPTGYGGSNLEQLFDAGGFVTAEGYAGASSLTATELAGITASSVDLGADGEPVEY